jgi:hypothetical protein
LLAGIENGESPRRRKKPGVNVDMDRSRILRELAAAERRIQMAKEIATSSEFRKPVSDEKKRGKS